MCIRDRPTTVPDPFCKPEITVVEIAACTSNQITTQECKNGVACVETDGQNCLCPSGVNVISASCQNKDSTTTSQTAPIECTTGYNLTCPNGYRLDTETNLCHSNELSAACNVLKQTTGMGATPIQYRSCVEFEGENLVDLTLNQCQSYAASNGMGHTKEDTSSHPMGCKLSPWSKSTAQLTMYHSREVGVTYETWRSEAGGHGGGDYYVVCRKNIPGCV